MPQEILWLSRDEFWAVIEECRQKTTDIESFARDLQSTLVQWDFHKLGAFHNTMWYDVGVFHGDELWDIVMRLEPMLGSQNAWECYGGWLIAQGRQFHESVMSDPQIAAIRVPSIEEVSDGETVIFAAMGACLEKTDGQYDLYDMLGDFLPPDAFSR